MTAEKKEREKKAKEPKEGDAQIRVAALRVFRVTFANRPDEVVMAHHCTFPHPREVLFQDIAFEGEMVLSYARRALYEWIDVREETPANTGSTVVQ